MTQYDWSTEPVMFLFMYAECLKFPVFKSLLFHKACYNVIGKNDTICDNVKITRGNTLIQEEENRIFLLSSICLFLPAMFTTFFIGSLSDKWSSKLTMLIPFSGLAIANLNYIIQCFFMKLDMHWLLISDLINGMVGGFPAIIGLLFAYCIKISSSEQRSKKLAVMEGFMGFGIMSGSICGGLFRQKFGYTNVYIIGGSLEFFCILYILILLKTNRQEANNYENKTFFSLFNEARIHFRENFEVFNLGHEKYSQRFLKLTLVSLFIEFICFSGLQNISFDYMRLNFSWTDLEYGRYNGFSIGVSSFIVIFFYPIFNKYFNISNCFLSIIGLITKIANLITLVIVNESVYAMVSVIFLFFVRFISTGLRSMASFYVKQNEQGKIFSLIALLNSFASFLATLIFNGSLMLNFKIKKDKNFLSHMFISTAIILIIPILILLYIERHPEEKNLRRKAFQSQDSINSTESIES